ncbi:hypothetical protein C8R46DRAFT_1091191 [Mycena filopes]|nr:hypothetical protein C8R46DRAFT_1091191 [Mycena filopes]
MEQKTRALIQHHPNAFHVSVAATSALFGLTMSPTLIPTCLTMATLLLYAPILFRRPHWVAYTLLLWVSVSLGSSVGRLVPALNALSTAGPSIAVLLGMSSLTSGVAIFAVFADVYICSHTGATQAVLFPAIWVSLWTTTSHLLPLGRLTSWTPVSGTQSYSWLAAWTGPAGIDWITAAWAVVISQTMGSWYMGPSEDNSLAQGKRRGFSRSGGTLILAVILTALTIPTFILSELPHPLNPPETATTLSVGCALPPSYNHDGATPSLDDYIDESKTVPARLVLWPESAVSFNSAEERDNAFLSIRKSIPARFTYWAVSFEEKEKISGDSGRASMSRNGLAILSQDALHMVYYKRFLVPIAESFSLSPGTSPPTMFPLPQHKPAHLPKKKWGNAPTRFINVTASICLDFSVPSLFRDLDFRPALILAPARTFDSAIGNRMWEEVKQRANEMGSVALWCDGGRGGVSGVAGGGYNDVFQAGEGSWSRTIGIPYPFDATPTFYARFGDGFVLVVALFLVFAPFALPHNQVMNLQALTNSWYERVRYTIRGFRRSRQQNLIDL